MKILAVGSHCLTEPNKQSQVDHWRIGRPMFELAKHVDWHIDHSPTFIPGFAALDNPDQFTPKEMQAAFDAITQYDIVFSSYHPDPTAYTLLKVARDRAGTQFVMDSDDDMFAINPDNPFWLKITDEQVYQMQRMIADNDWITTPSEVLAERYRQRRANHHPESVIVIPNYLPDVYQHPKVDNGDTIVIGYMGGASHYADLHESGVLPAIEILMHKYKNIHFKSVGMIVDHYIPKQRFTHEGGKRGTDFLTEVFPALNFDIAIAPLLDNLFNQGKSNIKWQEMTRAGAAFVCSDMPPYSGVIDGVHGLKVKNTVEEWQAALEKLIINTKLRRILVENAQREVLYNWRLETHWQQYKVLFEKVKRGIAHANNTTSPQAAILQTR